MSKLDAEQLGRKAFVYIRQSTPDQVQHNSESRRRQYGLVERAHALGFADVEVIDEDLGRSGSGIVRPGFERLLAAICGGEAGAVVAVEASRLARNGRDWHTLLEFCALVGTAIVDEEGAYDPRLPNDRLLLGMNSRATLSTSHCKIRCFGGRSAGFSHRCVRYAGVTVPTW
jgi:DNA invertase Pin-like site-specific DNA recombinase